jgi:hypothetical protein
MLMAALTTAILREAAKRGIKLLDEFLYPDVLVTLIPSENTIKRGAVLWQGVDDQLNEDDFAGTEAVFFINDAGNKKKKTIVSWPVTQVSLANSLFVMLVLQPY